jgi:hypothetical protein
MLEVRLPAGSEPVGMVEAGWIEKGTSRSHKLEVVAPREAFGRQLPEVHRASPSYIPRLRKAITFGSHVPEVHRALDILDALRAENDAEAQLASYKARRELAKLENRDPNLIVALDKMIAALTKEAAGVELETDDQPTSLDQLYLDSDTSSMLDPQQRPDNDILRDLLNIDIDSLSGADALEAAIAVISCHVRSQEITLQSAMDILEKYAKTNAKLHKYLKQMNTKNLLRRFS